MIQSLTVQNLQSHEASELTFSAGVNVVIGPSDAGKSALFRALSWILSNRPLGDTLCSEWGGDTKASIELSNGSVIERVRSKADNLYIVNGEKLKAFGQDPPESGIDLLAMDSVNIQHQSEPPFLLSNTPGEVARALNKAAGIDEIDRAVSGLRKGQQQIQSEVKSLNNQIQEQEEQLVQYEDLPQFEKEIEVIEQQERWLNQKRQTQSLLSGHVTRLRALRSVIANGEKLEGLSELVKDAENLKAQLTQSKEKRDDLSDCISRLKVLKSAIAKGEGLNELLDSTQEVKEVKDQFDQLQQKRDRLQSCIKNLNKVRKERESLNGSIEEKRKEYHEMAPDACPLCGAEWSE